MKAKFAAFASDYEELRALDQANADRGMEECCGEVLEPVALAVIMHINF